MNLSQKILYANKTSVGDITNYHTVIAPPVATMTSDTESRRAKINDTFFTYEDKRCRSGLLSGQGNMKKSTLPWPLTEEGKNKQQKGLRQAEYRFAFAVVRLFQASLCCFTMKDYCP